VKSTMFKWVNKKQAIRVALALILVAVVALSGVTITEKSPTTESSQSSVLQVGLGQKVLTIKTAEASGMADYTCTGLNDNVIFQTAINALPASGGKIEVLGGTYVFGAQIYITKSNVTIDTVGNSANFTIANGVNQPIFNWQGSGGALGDSYFDGNKANNLAMTNALINIQSVGFRGGRITIVNSGYTGLDFLDGSSDGYIEELDLEDNNIVGVRIVGGGANPPHDITIGTIHAYRNGTLGVVNESVQLIQNVYNINIGNHILVGLTGADGTTDGAGIETTSIDTAPTLNPHNITIGPGISRGFTEGYKFEANSSNITATGLIGYGNFGRGLRIYNSQNVTVSSSEFLSNGDSGVGVDSFDTSAGLYSISSGISLNGIISDNNTNNGVSLKKATDITINGGNYNGNGSYGIVIYDNAALPYTSHVVLNGIRATENKQYGVASKNNSDYVTLVGNDLTGNVVGGAILVGTHNSVSHNPGYVTESSGTGTILTGNTSVVVNHGLSITPVAGQIVVTPTSTMGNASYLYLDTYTSTQFTVHSNVDPVSANITFAWNKP